MHLNGQWECRFLNKQINMLLSLNQRLLLLLLRSGQHFRGLMGRIPNRSLVPIYTCSLGYETISGPALCSALCADQKAVLGLGRGCARVQWLSSVQPLWSDWTRRHTERYESFCCFGFVLFSRFRFVHVVVIKWTFTPFTHPETRPKKRWDSDHHERCLEMIKCAVWTVQQVPQALSSVPLWGVTECCGSQGALTAELTPAGEESCLQSKLSLSTWLHILLSDLGAALWGIYTRREALGVH